MKSSLLFYTVLASTTLAAQVAHPNAPQTPQRQESELTPFPDVSVHNDVVYGTVNGQKLLLDVYDPGDESTDRPAVLLIHGGGWSAFDKSTMKGMGTFLARTGFVAFAVDYRLTDGKTNPWPAQLDDVQRAVRWVRANAGEYRVDRDRIGAWGHSSGAQLAALLGLEDTRDNSDAALAKFSSRVEAVVDFAGPTDFTTNHDHEGDAFLSAFFGGDYAHKADVWKDASPVFHVSRNSAPFLIIHGSHDEEVPIAQAQELADKLKQAKVPVNFITMDEGHTFRTEDAKRRLAFESEEFFKQYLRHGQ